VAIELHLVVKNFETMPLGDAVLEGFKCLVLKLDNLSTPKADQMVMVPLFRRRLIPSLSVCKFSLGSQPQTGQEFKGTIDGGEPNFWMGLCHLGINLSQVLMARRIEKDVENLFPLFGCLQTLCRDPRFEGCCFNERAFLKLNFNFILIDFTRFVKAAKTW
jgi:hypothetical protein